MAQQITDRQSNTEQKRSMWEGSPYTSSYITMI